MAGRISDVVDGYAALASSMFERWSALASSTARRFDAGEYDAASATDDLAAGAALAAEGGALWVAESLEALAGLCGCDSSCGAEIVTSQPFQAPYEGASLKLTGPLTRGPGLPDELPVSVVSIEPSRLRPTETEFRLRANATGHRGGTYVGRVLASIPGGSTLVIVWIAVP
jgi:hypothetical protein